VRILRRADYRATPWKNGRGIAYQIAAAPADAGYDTLDWQVSRPQIGADTPFSSLPGLDRQFMLVGGRGVTLACRSEADGVAFERSIAAPLEPFAFRGDWDVQCTLHDGPVEVLNIMTRRGRCGARVEIVDVASGHSVAKAAGETLLVYVARGPVEAWGTWGKATLMADDSILVDDPGATEITTAPAGVAEDASARLALVRLAPALG
jgi:environmental stress-induced protein Ves